MVITQMSTIKIKTIYGKILTVTIKEQTDEFISGFDKNGIYTKVLLRDIENCFPVEDTYGN